MLQLVKNFNTKLVEDYIKSECMSKASFARRCGISPTTLYKFLQDPTTCKIGTVVTICRQCGLNLVDVLNM